MRRARSTSAGRSGGTLGGRNVAILGAVLVALAIFAVVSGATSKRPAVTGSGKVAATGSASATTGSGGAASGSSAAGSGTATSGAGGSLTAASATPAQIARWAAAGTPLLGSPKAPVLIVEYADFQCPFCGRFARTEEPALVSKYVNTGVVKLEWHDFPFYGPESVNAAVAARAAGLQGKFWQYHNALYAHQFPINSGHLTTAYLQSLARSLGLNMAAFDANLNNPALRSSVVHDYAEGQNLGITGTPTFFINGKEMVGAQPLSVFEQAINTAAAQAGKSGSTPAGGTGSTG